MLARTFGVPGDLTLTGDGAFPGPFPDPSPIGVPGDHPGQTSNGIRMPFGGVAVITPFNFPLEIPALQTASALFSAVAGLEPTTCG